MPSYDLPLVAIHDSRSQSARSTRVSVDLSGLCKAEVSVSAGMVALSAFSANYSRAFSYTRGSRHPPELMAKLFPCLASHQLKLGHGPLGRSPQIKDDGRRSGRFDWSSAAIQAPVQLRWCPPLPLTNALFLLVTPGAGSGQLTASGRALARLRVPHIPTICQIARPTMSAIYRRDCIRSWACRSRRPAKRHLL